MAISSNVGLPKLVITLLRGFLTPVIACAVKYVPSNVKFDSA
jgi:hypothetical protein